MKDREKHSKDFKLDAIRLVREQGYSQAAAARNLGISRGMLCRWIKEFDTGNVDAFPGNGKMSSEQEHIRGLEKRIKRLEMEKEILKKATVFFAAEMT